MISVFIVEDEEIEREALAGILRTRYRDRVWICGTADEGSCALQQIRERTPDIVFLDIRIGGTSGLEVARRLRSEELGSEIVIVSAYSRFEYAAEAVRLQAVDYILKPYSLKTLDAIMERLIRRITDRRPGADAHVPVDPIERARAHIEQYCATDLTLDAVSSVAGLSKYHFSRRFRATVGMGIKEYQVLCRVERAERLLVEGLTVAEAGRAVGFSDPNYFSRVVKRTRGVSPRALKLRN